MSEIATTRPIESERKNTFNPDDYSDIVVDDEEVEVVYRVKKTHWTEEIEPKKGNAFFSDGNGGVLELPQWFDGVTKKPSSIPAWLTRLRIWSRTGVWVPIRKDRK